MLSFPAGGVERPLSRGPKGKERNVDRVAVFVDAGYLIARGGEAKWGPGMRREDLRLDVPAVCEVLSRFARRTSGLPLLRIYWYDAARQGHLSIEQLALASQNDVKLRLGELGFDGKQKGVDSLLVTDMITLARNGAMAECVLVAGDADIREGVHQAQEHGVRIHLLVIATDDGSMAQSNLLFREVDQTSAWTSEDIGPFIERLEFTPSTDGDEDALDRIAREEARFVPEAAMREIVNQFDRTGWIDRDWNNSLLGRAKRTYERFLDHSETDRIRSAFVEALRTRLEPDAERETNDD